MNSTQQQPTVRAFCASCRDLQETPSMERVEGEWHCKPCAQEINEQREEFFR
jgi:formylmethanofuran dehydrogenase subunit E